MGPGRLGPAWETGLRKMVLGLNLSFAPAAALGSLSSEREVQWWAEPGVCAGGWGLFMLDPHQPLREKASNANSSREVTEGGHLPFTQL